MIEAICIFLGAVVGAAVALCGAFYTARQQFRADKLKIATEVALEHFRASKWYFEKTNCPNLQPPSSFIAYYFELFDIVEKQGKLTIDEINELNKRRPELASSLVNRPQKPTVAPSKIS